MNGFDEEDGLLGDIVSVEGTSVVGDDRDRTFDSEGGTAAKIRKISNISSNIAVVRLTLYEAIYLVDLTSVLDMREESERSKHLSACHEILCTEICKEYVKNLPYIEVK